MSPSDGLFGGVHAMLYAFFTPAGGLDRGAMRAQVAACLASGVQGLAVLGLATEVSKLTPVERRTLVDWTLADAAGRAPVAVTIFGHDTAEQQAALRDAERAGAAWAILQPPPQPGMGEDALAAFFAPTIDGARIPVAVQNAPELMGLGLSPPALGRLAAAHPMLRAMKAEGPAVTIAEVAAQTGLPVLNGRGGLELPDNHRAGCAGMMPAPDCVDLLVRAWHAMEAGGDEGPYRDALPAIAFAMQSVAHLVCYGKRIVGARLGLGAVTDRGPGLTATPFGTAAAARFAAALGPYPG